MLEISGCKDKDYFPIYNYSGRFFLTFVRRVPLLLHFGYNIFLRSPLHESLDKGYFLLEREISVEPMEGYPLPFHAAEPGHLPLGETTDVGVKVVVHLVVGAFLPKVTGDVAVFESVAQEALLGDTVSERPTSSMSMSL